MIQALASQWGVLIVFPGLVLAVGFFLTWMAQDALRGSNLELARTRMSDQALLVSEHLGSALGQADVVLDELGIYVLNISADTKSEEVALPLRRLLSGRPGASYVSVSFPDGTFMGAFVDDDRTLRFQVSKVIGDHTDELVYDYGERGALILRETRKSKYDPRSRPFYELALRAKKPVWTEPYPFARTGDTGITRAHAVSADGTATHAVVTVDFDVRRLSPLLQRERESAERPLLFNASGTILADPQLRLRQGPSKGPAALLNYQAAGDPVLTAFFEAKARATEPYFQFETPSGQYLAANSDLLGETDLDWSVAFLAPESSFLASLESYSRRSYIIAGIALLIAALASTAFARIVVAVRKEASEAREAAKQARREAKELGSYRLVQLLGVGGMGEVWRAEHRLLAREAAIKLIKSDQDGREGGIAQERFRREAQSLAALRSRNTIELFDYGMTEDGTFFYVMELLDGLDLETLIARSGAQPAARVVKLLIQACRSLAEAHSVGLVHRDIKPANIFVCRVADELDVVKVLDFGLVRSLASDTEEPLPTPSIFAKKFEEAAELQHSDGPVSDPHDTIPITNSGAPDSGPKLTRADNIMGTPEFMAPEQVLGKAVDGRADIYALGCVGYWLLAGRTVFETSHMMAQLTSHLTAAPPDLAKICPTPPPQALSHLLGECLAKEPDQRPQTAADMMRRLQEIDRMIGHEWDEEVEPWWSAHQTRASGNIEHAGDVSLAQTMIVAQPVSQVAARRKA